MSALLTHLKSSHLIRMESVAAQVPGNEPFGVYVDLNRPSRTDGKKQSFLSCSTFKMSGFVALGDSELLFGVKKQIKKVN